MKKKKIQNIIYCRLSATATTTTSSSVTVRATQAKPKQTVNFKEGKLKKNECD